MLLCISDITMPYDNSVASSFSHIQPLYAVVKALEEENIKSALVPAGCTDQLQVLDLTTTKTHNNFASQLPAMVC